MNILLAAVLYVLEIVFVTVVVSGGRRSAYVCMYGCVVSLSSTYLHYDNNSKKLMLAVTSSSLFFHACCCMLTSVGSMYIGRTDNTPRTAFFALAYGLLLVMIFAHTPSFYIQPSYEVYSNHNQPTILIIIIELLLPFVPISPSLCGRAYIQRCCSVVLATDRNNLRTILIIENNNNVN